MNHSFQTKHFEDITERERPVAATKMLMPEGPAASESAEYGIRTHTAVEDAVGVDDSVEQGGRMYKEDA